MANPYSTIGAATSGDEEFLALVRRVAEEGDPIATGRGTYYRLTDGSGAELWVQLDTDGEVVGMAPHFAGASSFTLRLTGRIERDTDSPLDGSFHAWAPDEDDETPVSGPDEGVFPLVFDVPDGGAHDDLRLPALRDVQLAAFAHECTFHESEDAFAASQGDEELKFASESFIPAGLMGAEDDVPSAMALFTAVVIDTRQLVNDWTGQPFRWARVRMLGGELDVVADLEIIDGAPVAGGVVNGVFWLSGKLPEPASGDTAAPTETARRGRWRWSRRRQRRG